MAMVFFSYKHGTDGVERLVKEFRQRGYAIWFDKESIKVGDMDWRDSISKGIRDSDIFILCVTRSACDSEYVRTEVQQALEKQRQKLRAGNKDYKFVFPVTLESFGDKEEELAPNLQKLGLDHFQAAILHKIDTRDSNLNMLFDEISDKLRKLGIDASVHADRNSDPQKKELHQRYWRQLRHTLGRQPLMDSRGHSSNAASARIEVEKIYVPVPTDLRLVYDIFNYDIEQWWLAQDSGLKTGIDYNRRPAGEPKHVLISSKSERNIPGWDFAGLDFRIQNHRQQLDELKSDQQYARFGRLDTATETIALTAEEAVSAIRRLILVGDSGSGRTLFTHYFVTTLAGELLDPSSVSKTAWWHHTDFNVVYFEMRLLAEYLDEHGWDPEALLGYVDAYLSNLSKMDLGAYADILRSEIENGTAILVIEDVDTVLVGKSKRIEKRSKQLHDLMTSVGNNFKNTRIILTMGTRALDHWQPSGMQVVRLLPLEKSAQLPALKKYVETYKPDEVDNLPEIAAVLDKFDARLAGNPRLIALLALLHEQPGLLYRRIVSLLLENEHERLAEVFDDTVEKSKDLALGFLTKFAYESLRTYPMSNPPNSELYDQFTLILNKFTETEGEDLSTDTVKDYLLNYSGIFVGSGDTFRFAHNDIRLYLAAEYVYKTKFLRTEMPGRNPQQILRELILHEPDAWSNAYSLVGDIIPGSIEQMDFWELVIFIDDLLPNQTPQTLDADAPEVYITWLAGHIASDRKIPGMFKDNSTHIDDKRIESVRYQLTNWLMRIVETPGAPLRHLSPDTIDVVRRAEIGSLLGRIGDQRQGIGVVSGDTQAEVPDIWWIEIPVGEVRVERETPDRKKEKMNCLVERFRISKYPVTVEQFLAFVKAGGYEDDKYWLAGGWKFKDWGGDPRSRWSDLARYPLNHPITGVTWYEAMAFCQWMNEQFPDVNNVRLPTRLEWQRAARGFTDRLYSYEGEFNPVKANGRLTGIGRTSAVGLFDEPGDQYSRFGLSDMSGNVYNWCLDVNEDDQYALVGGSWKSYPGFMTIDACHFDLPENSSDYWGFRLVCD